MLKKTALITLLIIALAAVGTLAYQQLTPTKEAEPEQETGQGESGMIKTQEAPTAPEFPEIDTSNWETYRNEKYGFELKYPRKWDHLTEYPVKEKMMLDGTVKVIEFFRAPSDPPRFYPVFARYEFYAGNLANFGGRCNLDVYTNTKLEFITEKKEIAGVDFVRIAFLQYPKLYPEDEDYVVEVRYVTHRGDICYGMLYAEFITNGVRKSPYTKDKMKDFIQQFEDIVATFRFLDQPQPEPDAREG